MSRTTEITCDRCGQRIVGRRAWKVEMVSSRTTVELDWCEPCADEVRERVDPTPRLSAQQITHNAGLIR